MPYRCVKCGKLIEDGEESVWIRHQHYHLNCHYSNSTEEFDYLQEE